MIRRSYGFLFLLSMAVFLAGIEVAVAQMSDIAPLDLPKNPVVSLTLKDADVTDVFRLLAEQNDLNIVVSPTVRGTISIRLSDVTLEEAMRVILDAANARLERTQNIIYITQRDQADKLQQVKVELITEIFSVNYVDTNQLVDVANDFLSVDGRIKTFNRAKNAGTGNKPPMMIVIDHPQNVDTIRKLIENLDKETPQIAIQAKIVETALDNQDIMGTDWNPVVNFTGSPAKIDTPYSYGGGINYGILSFDAFTAVWKRIVENKANNVLSDAKLTTLDNEKARIHVGETIPVGINTVVPGSGNVVTATTGVQEWDVGISLDVTPHVLDKGVIMMKIEPEVSSVKSFASLGGSNNGNAPITSKRSVDTNIMLRSGETIVIAGLVQTTENLRNSKVPLLGNLPLVGSIFRRKENVTTKTNLLIFITAKVMDLRSKPELENTVAQPNPDNLDKYLEYK